MAEDDRLDMKKSQGPGYNYIFLIYFIVITVYLAYVALFGLFGLFVGGDDVTSRRCALVTKPDFDFASSPPLSPPSPPFLQYHCPLLTNPVRRRPPA